MNKIKNWLKQDIKLKKWEFFILLILLIVSYFEIIIK